MSVQTATGVDGQVKILAFDIFGTCVDWKSSVIQALVDAANGKTTCSDFASLPAAIRTRTMNMARDDWAVFAQEWRNSYKSFCKAFVPGTTSWKDIDAHHFDSLVELLTKWKIPGLYSDREIKSLSLVWHRLRPWSDTSEGISELNKLFVTASLSNGNPELLRDLNDFGSLGFQNLISAANFMAYKPNPKVYLGAAATLGCHPREIAMVAAHLSDLDGARQCGMKTIYVERHDEEDWSPDEERYQLAQKWVDVWVSADEGGFLELARRLAGQASS